jgi:hypothetical protein
MFESLLNKGIPSGYTPLDAVNKVPKIHLYPYESEYIVDGFFNPSNNDLILINGTGGTITVTGFTTPNIVAENIYNSDGNLTNDRTVLLTDYSLIFNSSVAPNHLVLRDGNVGIDRLSPAYTLDVNGTGNFEGTLKIGSVNLGPSDTKVLTLSTDGTVQYINLTDISGSTPTNISVSANTGLGIVDGTLYTIYNSTLDPNTTMGEKVGGIPQGTTLSQLTGKTFVQLFDDLLFPVANPTYTIPTITMSGPTTSTLEVGLTYAPNINVFGVKNDAGDFTQLRILRNGSPLFTDTTLTTSSESNVPNQFGFNNPNNPNLRYTISPTPFSESYEIPAPSVGQNSSITVYRGDGNYNSGLSKLNNKGQMDSRSPQVRSVNAPQSAANNFQTADATITGIYPYFWGTSPTLPDEITIANEIASGNANKVLQSASGTISINYNVDGEFIWVAYFGGYTTKTRWWRSDLDTSTIDNSFITTASTGLVSSPQGLWSGIEYKIHWSVYPTVQQNFEYRNS